MANIYLKGRREPVEVSSKLGEAIRKMWAGDTRNGQKAAPTSTKITTEWDTFEVGEIKRIDLSGSSAASREVQATTDAEIEDCAAAWERFERDPLFPTYGPTERQIRFLESVGAGVVREYLGQPQLSIRPEPYRRWQRIYAAWNHGVPLWSTERSAAYFAARQAVDNLVGTGTARA